MKTIQTPAIAYARKAGTSDHSTKTSFRPGVEIRFPATTANARQLAPAHIQNKPERVWIVFSERFRVPVITASTPSTNTFTVRAPAVTKVTKGQVPVAYFA